MKDLEEEFLMFIELINNKNWIIWPLRSKFLN